MPTSSSDAATRPTDSRSETQLNGPARIGGRRLRVLQVNTGDTVGGAARVSRSLFESYRARGHASWLAVGHKLVDDPDVLAIPNEPAPGRLLRVIGKTVEAQLGIEDFRFPGTAHLMALTPEEPDIVHCHNLHGQYFDLRALAWLSQKVPVVLTLHDAWLLTGHCAHSLDSERWKTGCGHCPYLWLYPAVKRDATAYNWRRKQQIYASSRLFVATPCRWLMEMVEQSMLSTAVVEGCIIPNGVDLSIFVPANREAARARLGIRLDARVLLFAGQGLRDNMWKDFETVRLAMARIAQRLSGDRLVLIGLGGDGPTEQIGEAEIHFVPYQKESSVVASYYQAADAYVHAARADTFPSSVLEALACGTPVVATAVGGIPEQIEDGQTGFLVGQGDVDAFARQLVRVLSDEELRRNMSRRAAEVARRRFDLEQQADAYLGWYDQLASRHATSPPMAKR